MRGVSQGAELIADERRRQTDAEGFSYRHDDLWEGDELALAAVQYATPYNLRSYIKANPETPTMWPFRGKDWKPVPDNRVRELIKAGALIAAEIDRLLRVDER